MKKLLLLITISGLSSFAKAQVDSTIYGLTRKNSDLYFAKINPLTGGVTNISTASMATCILNANATLDPFKQYYYFNNCGTFIGVDMATGNIVSNPTITNSDGTSISGFHFNCADSTIYGLTRKNFKLYFSKINPSTGVITNISSSPLATCILNGEATIDPLKKIYYFNNCGTFIGVDITTGNIVSNPTITNSDGASFTGFHFNCADSVIYGLTRKTFELYFSKINPSTGVITNISSSPLATCILNGNATIDPFKKIYYFNNCGTFVGVDLTTGNTLINPIITNPNGTSLYGFLYNKNNCFDTYQSTDSKIILEMPNVFTPNNDGNNDVFHPVKMNGISNARLLIYNKWGNSLFETRNLIAGWDGKIKNEDATDGIYYWILEYENIKKENLKKTGFLTLIK